MKKIITCVFLSVILCLTLVACGTNTSTNNEAKNNNSVSKNEKTNDPIDLKLVDSHYVITNGYVHYTLAVENPNENYMPEFAHIKITGKKTDGSISFNDDWTISSLAPCSTTYWATQAGDGNTANDDTIEISVSVDKDDWIKADKKPDNLYVFNNISVKTGTFKNIKTTGEITLTDASVDYGTNGLQKPMLVCVFKDAEGKLVGGFNGYLNSDLTEGTPSAFEINCYHDIGKYDTVEMYANPWL